MVGIQYMSCFLRVIQTSWFGKYLVNRGLLLSVKFKKSKKTLPHIRNDLVVESRETQLKIHMKRCRMRAQGQPRIMVRLNVICSDQIWRVLTLFAKVDQMINTKWFWGWWNKERHYSKKFMSSLEKWRSKLLSWVAGVIAQRDRMCSKTKDKNIIVMGKKARP